MAEKDKVEKVLEDYVDVFADIYNTLVFGKAYLQAGQLKDGQSETVHKERKGFHRGYFRDMTKNYYNSTFMVASYGIENQSTVEKYMPVRIMGYDYGNYQRQVRKKQRKLTPTITIVLNFSEKRWRKPKSLHKLMNLPRELEPLVQDYCIQVFDIAYLEDEVIEQFQSDFKVVARFFKQRRIQKDGFVLGDDVYRIEHLEAVMDLISVFTGDEAYWKLYEEVLKTLEEKGEKITMCRVAEAYINKGREEGLKAGLEEGHKAGLEEGHKVGLEEGHKAGLEEGRKAGRQEGRQEGRTSTIMELIAGGALTLKRGAELLNKSVEELTTSMEQYHRKLQ